MIECGHSYVIDKDNITDHRTLECVLEMIVRDAMKLGSEKFSSPKLRVENYPDHFHVVFSGTKVDSDV